MKYGCLFFVAMIAVSCSNSTSSVNGNKYDPDTQPQLLLQGATFDSSGAPSLKGWTYGSSDLDSIPQFLQDVPTGLSAKWSVVLHPGWIPSTEYVYRDFLGLTSGIYKLTLWSKTTGHGGSFHIEKSASPVWLNTSGGDSTKFWQEYSLLDTLTLSAHDTVRIMLTGGSTELGNWDVFYNDITFEKLQ